MAINQRDLVVLAVGFILVAIMTPIGMSILSATNSTFGVAGSASAYAPVYTIFTVLLQVLYLGAQPSISFRR